MLIDSATAPAAAQSKGSRFPAMLRIFAPPPPALAKLTAPDEIQAGYRLWRNRVLLSTIIGYATFYFVRKNLGIAMPVMEASLGISKSNLGLFLTLHGVIYGVAKFANGFFADRCNARVFMVVGLVASALLNICFGLSSTVLALGIFWMLNGWFQGMGFPPCARLMTHWFPPKQLATKMSIWNISHSIGASLIVVLCGYLVIHSWRLCFFVPATIALLISIFLWFKLADTPPSVGLPELEGTRSRNSEDQSDDFKQILLRHVFSNKYIWLVALANFSVYTVRYAILDWGPTLLTQAKHVELAHAGWMVAGFEVAGLVGMLSCGWLTDNVFGGRGMRACFFYMGLASLSILLFWKVSGESRTLNTLFLCAAGFFIYGPQALVGIIAANLATKRAAASAIGLTGLFGYASTILSGWSLGWLVEKHGWNAGFIGMLIISTIGTMLFLLGWKAKADGYTEEEHGVERNLPKPRLV
jgi:OPA family glycerol-3-phosphate transporter-like MFS transporter/OPA family sugar phosphate sensor protein UhpC-like MFS transporter